VAIFELSGIAPELPAHGAYWIAETAAVIGRVRLRIHACVWFGAVLRGDDDAIELGERSHILDNCVLHPDYGLPVLIGSDCLIGPRAILHGCTVGSNSVVGAGATVLNRAKVGRNCIVCPGALVSERKEFPDNSLIAGHPARLVQNTGEKGAAVEKRPAFLGWHLYASKLKKIR
jgi:carbonic anhydrase/acetyltransferase-like protein (isoleucine patch superfamily)